MKLNKDLPEGVPAFPGLHLPCSDLCYDWPGSVPGGWGLSPGNTDNQSI